MKTRYAIFTKDDELFESGFEKERIAKQVARYYLKSGGYFIVPYNSIEDKEDDDTTKVIANH